MRMMAAATALLVVVAGCSDSGSATTTGPDPVTGATAGPPTTVAATVTEAPATSEAPPVTTRPAPTTSLPTGEARFSVTQITFGGNGFVQITNTGDGPGDLGGHWLCQRPNYFMLGPGPIELDPGQAVWVAVDDGAGLDVGTSPVVVALIALEGALGALTATGGDVALYATREFDSADAIRDYVAWSQPDRLPRLGRAGVAIQAGIWVSGGLVTVPRDGIAITVIATPATSPDGWVADFGG